MGHHGQIRIKPGGFFIIVSCANLGEVFHLLPVHAGNQAQLGMHLVAVQAIDHVAARALQPAGPLDIVLLVKAGLELHQHQHILAVFRRLDQGGHHFALLGHPVQGHLDGDHLVVRGRFPQHGQEGLHAVKGVGQELVLLPDLRQDGLPGNKLRGALWEALGIKQFRALAQHVLDLKQKAQVQGGGVAEHRVPADIHILAQFLHHVPAQGPGHLQADGRQAPAALDEVRHKLPVIQVIVIEGVGVNVRVPRGADQGLFPNRIALERLGDEV